MWLSRENPQRDLDSKAFRLAAVLVPLGTESFRCDALTRVAICDLPLIEMTFTASCVRGSKSSMPSQPNISDSGGVVLVTDD